MATNLTQGALQPTDPMLSAANTVQAQPVQPQNQTNLPTTTTPDPSSGGFMGHFLQPLKEFGKQIYESAGTPTPTYSVNDSTGQLIKNAETATPGTMFKKLLVGALTGLGAGAQARGAGAAGAIGAGFSASEQQQQEQDDRARQQAVQQFQMKQAAQKAQDEHSAATSDQAVKAAQTVMYNAQTANLAFNMHQNSQEYQNQIFNNEKGDEDYLLKNGAFVVKKGVDGSELQKLMGSDTSTTHNVIGKLVGEEPILDAQGNEIMVPMTTPDGRQIIDPDTKQPMMQPKMKYVFDVLQTPDDHKLTPADIKRYSSVDVPGFDVGTVKPDQVISGGRWMQLENNYRQAKLQDLNERELESNIAAHKATMEAESARAQNLLEDLKDKKLQTQAEQDWSMAMSQPSVAQIPERAAQWLQQNKPNTYGLLAGAEAQDIAKNGETETVTSSDGSTKTLVKRKRLFTKEEPPQAQSGTIPVGAEVIVNPTTGQRMYSTDGRKTWIAVTQGAAATTPPDQDTVVTATTPIGPMQNTIAELEKYKKEHPGFTYTVTGKAPISDAAKPAGQVMSGLSLTGGQ